MKDPEVSIIIPTYKRDMLVDKLLTNWFSRSNNFSYELIVMDNGSGGDGYQKLFEKWRHEPTVRWVEYGANIGFGAANNRGARLARGEFLVLANPDTLILENGITPLVDYLKSNPDVGIVGAKLIGTESGNVQDSYRHFMRPFDWLIKRMRFLYRFPIVKNYVADFLMWNMDNSKLQEVDWLQGSCMFFRRQEFLDIGGFDPRFFIFMEDMDLCRRFWAKGQKVIYNPNAAWNHGDKRASEKGFFHDLTNKMAWIHLASLIKYFLKWGIGRPKYRAGREQNTVE